MNIIQMPIDPTYKVISHRENINKTEIFIITGITESEYHKLKKLIPLNITRGNAEFNIDPDEVFCFGEIDFSEGSEDSVELDTFNWLDHLVAKGVTIPANYNYEKHQCTSPISKYLMSETVRISTLCRYLHGCLGKPQFTVIFREFK